LRITNIFVTHDQREALAVADRIALLLDGRIEQCGQPRELLLNPCSARAAQFFGWVLLTGERRGQTVRTAAGQFDLPQAGEDGQCYLAFRPENVRLSSSQNTGGNLSGKLESLIDFGARWHWRVRLHNGEVIEAGQDHTPNEYHPRPGDDVNLILQANAVRWFPRASELRRDETAANQRVGEPDA
jgi:ABC-type Fe3+/spermidine/putrescine transport system ATPase subunit